MTFSILSFCAVILNLGCVAYYLIISNKLNVARKRYKRAEAALSASKVAFDNYTRELRASAE